MRGAFDGEGARLVGGRWSSPGRRAVYASESTSLAILETLVHLEPRSMPALVVFEVQVPSEISTTIITPSELPDNWQEVPAPAGLVDFGNAWVERAETALLVVPSARVPTENNVVLNPLHPDCERLSIGKPRAIVLDRRLS